MKQMKSVEEFDNQIETAGTFFILKHSTTCPISQAAYDEYVKFSNGSELPTFYLTVQESRRLSNHIAEKYEITHESPQAILFKDSKPAWHASHWKITGKSLKQAAESGN
ncbi:bacillithiol system redox-active protein YtxJ [Bacillus sp. T33-2]|uniref:bacillithiol system redox-active protein YtxJ n=1 Tax=Bacillus sp. T33-2 TaxID=2054168 RepID=UPI000C75B2F1|nr:bacillithiol system redox-active protein YtxJ [Bacillus sp. T33-2]PLR98173.1 bacillithiol system redox-active protein YtxJ [Bacillus sp. T33-2]